MLDLFVLLVKFDGLGLVEVVIEMSVDNFVVNLFVFYVFCDV